MAPISNFQTAPIERIRAVAHGEAHMADLSPAPDHPQSSGAGHGADHRVGAIADGDASGWRRLYRHRNR